MIKRLELKGLPTYGPEPVVVADLTKVNFVYGANGVGKSTLARVLEDHDVYPSCEIQWESGRQLETRVYNRDFVDRNFSANPNLKGVFTLGEADIATLSNIASAKKEISELSNQIAQWRNTLEGQDGQGGKRKEREEVRIRYRDRLWRHLQKHEDTFAVAFTRVRKSKERFFERILTEAQSNEAIKKSLASLTTDAATLFGPQPVQHPLLQEFQPEALESIDGAEIVGKVIVGRSDLDISGLITKLGNTDWVRKGREYADASDGVCPYCQQTMPVDLDDKLGALFDEQYEADLRKLCDFNKSYREVCASLGRVIETVIESESSFVDREVLAKMFQTLKAKVQLNYQSLDQKLNGPSTSITLEPLGEILNSIKRQLDSANERIRDHNRLVSNFAKERERLIKEVWQFIVGVEAKADLENYYEATDPLDKAIESLESRITAAEDDFARKRQELQRLEQTVTSIQPTIDAINSILKSLNFTNFLLAESHNSPGQYKVIRNDGSDVSLTLSEGERSFISFLYFYHLLEGSDTESNIDTDRIVVFDDPVTSMDSGVLFYVSTLIRKAVRRALDGEGNVKQVFVLTHNVYFHKEVTFQASRQKEKGKVFISYWVIRKRNNKSIVERHNKNPVKTAYQRLWQEIQDPAPGASLQNSLRRILEYYFSIIGDDNYENICDKLPIEMQTMAHALLSWINSGSHDIGDDLYVGPDDSENDRFLDVFKSIFEVSGHIAHYEMMMATCRRSTGST